MYNRTPFYPGACAPAEPVVRMPLFTQKPCGSRPSDPCRPHRPPRSCPPCPPPGVPAAPPVCVVNPFNPCERATVQLSVDECGNLIVCVRR